MRQMSAKRESRLLERIVNKEFHLLGWGSTRATFAINDNMVAKVTVDPLYNGQNQNEVEVAKVDKGAHTARIYAYGDRIILAERVQPIDVDDEYCNCTDCQIDRQEAGISKREEIDFDGLKCKLSSVTEIAAPNFESSFCKAPKRSVSLIFSVCKPVK